MRPLLPLLALLLVPAAAHGGPIEAARARALAHFLTHAANAPTIDTLGIVIPPDAEGQELALYIAAAREVQLGCVSPCVEISDIIVYRGKIELLASKFGATGPVMIQAIDRYFTTDSNGRKVPRPRAAGASAPSGADRLVEGKVLEKLLGGNLSPRRREELKQKALAYAEALGRTTLISSDGAVSGGGSGPGRTLTPAQLAALNRLPGAQAQILRSLALKPPPPPPTPQQLSDAAMDEGEREIQADPGTVRQARNYWIDESRDPKSNVLWRGYSYFNRGLLAVSGLTEVEESAARAGWASGHGNVTARRAVWEDTKLITNSALFAANFLGLSGGTQVVQRARALDNPVVIEGLEAMSRSTARRVATRVEEVNTVVAKALTREGGRDMRAATQAMDRYAAEELGGAFRVERGGKWAQADYYAAQGGERAGAIKYSPVIGEAHEFTHAQQMLVNRATAMEIVAARTGKTAATLTDAELRTAMDLASRMEKAYVAQHEAQALRTAGILGLFPGSGTNYATKLAANGTELTAAWMGKPAWTFTRPQRVFGALSGMGENQLAIAGTLVTHVNIPYVRDKYGNLIEVVEGVVSDALPPATSPNPVRPAR